MPLYDFKCRHCHTLTEELVKHTIHEIVCPNCGKPSNRQVCAPKPEITSWAEGPNASQPAIDKWDRMRRKKMAIEERKLRDHGTYE